MDIDQQLTIQKKIVPFVDGAMVRGNMGWLGFIQVWVEPTSIAIWNTSNKSVIPIENEHMQMIFEYRNLHRSMDDCIILQSYIHWT